MRTRQLCCLLGVSLVAVVAAPGASAGWGPVGTDPTSNYVPGPLPVSCASAPTGAECINAGVYYLDAARATLGQPPYALPADFPSLTPPEQDFILTNLDRIQVGLPPVPGLTDELNNNALTTGVEMDGDPQVSQTNDPNIYGASANWAGWFTNMVFAYEIWMYDDGVGSPNRDCPASGGSGCWGHRHGILWDFGANHVLAMGAAAGTDPSGRAGYAMLIAYGDEPGNGLNPGYSPVYTYTWSQAVADGAGTNPYDPGVPQITPVAVRVVVDGPGTVSDGAGHTCTATCTFDETPGSAVQFVATPSSGATFSGWSGSCSGSGTCTLTPYNSYDYEVDASFAAPSSTGGGSGGGGNHTHRPRLSIGVVGGNVYLHSPQRGRARISVHQGKRVLGRRTVRLGGNGAVVKLRTIVGGKRLRAGRYVLVVGWQGRTFRRTFRVA